MNNHKVTRCSFRVLSLAMCLPLYSLMASELDLTVPTPGGEVHFLVGNVPDCNAANVVKDTWLLRIPENSPALKDKLFTILKFTSFKGFGVNTVPSEATDELDLYIYFNEKAFLISDDGTEKIYDTKSANLVKTKILQAIDEVIAPAVLKCVDLAAPKLQAAAEMAAMGVAAAADSSSAGKSDCSVDNIAGCFDPSRAGGVTGSNGCRIDDNTYFNPGGGTDNWSTNLDDKIRKILEN